MPRAKFEERTVLKPGAREAVSGTLNYIGYLRRSSQVLHHVVTYSPTYEEMKAALNKHRPDAVPALDDLVKDRKLTVGPNGSLVLTPEGQEQYDSAKHFGFVKAK